MTAPIQDSDRAHWVNRSPLSLRPYLQLSRLDRPVGYWLLALPGWIGLAFASLSHGFASSDVKWAILILIGAIAMRGAGCTYNDIVDQDLDAQVERTSLRPLPAGTVISLASIPLVAAYPFMKRITWWPQVWLGMTFNWAVLVAYAAKTDTVSLPLFILYAGLIFWTVGYDTIYACQDIEDDMKIGVKSTARRFGKQVKFGVGVSYAISVFLIYISVQESFRLTPEEANIPPSYTVDISLAFTILMYFLPISLFTVHLLWQILTLDIKDNQNALKRFKSNFWSALLLVFPFLIYH